MNTAISDKCFVISPRIPSLRVAEQCRYIFVTFYVDINDNLTLSLNCENKELDDKETSDGLYESIQDAFAPRYAERNTGSNGLKCN